MKSEVLDASDGRLFPSAIISVYDTADAVAELQRAASMGFKLFYMPTTPPADRQYNDEVWGRLRGSRHGARIPHRYRNRAGAVPAGRAEL